MLQERFAIYCFDLEKTLFAPVRYLGGAGKSLGEILNLSAWIQKLTEEGGGLLPGSFPGVPREFKPKIISYSEFVELDSTQPIDRCKDNIFVVLMPEFDASTDSKVLELTVESRYRDHMRRNNIEALREAGSEDVIDMKPNFYGVGLNLNALWKRLFKST